MEELGTVLVADRSDGMRELLAVPEVWPKDYRTKFRADDISVRKPLR